MASAVFLRAVNVAGHQVLRPSEVAKRLARLGVVSIGAAGTFVVRERASAAAVRAAFLAAMPLAPDILVRPGKEVLDLVAARPFDGLDQGRPFVTVLPRRPASVPRLPLDGPSGKPWEVRLVDVRGAFAMTLVREGLRGITPNALVDKVLVPGGTTRAWTTMEKVAQALAAER